MKKTILLMTLTFIAGAGLMWLFKSTQKPEPAAPPSAEKEPQIWTCSMHPSVRLPGPGQCPICFMDLIPLDEESSSGGELSLSPAAIAVADIQTAQVQRVDALKTVRLYGRMAFDESRIRTITSWVGGRIEKLFVDYTGVRVGEGEHLLQLYSPELITAQRSYLQALEAETRFRDSNLETLQQSAVLTLEDAREKLRLLGMTSSQIQQLEAEKTIPDTITIYAPAQGLVVEKKVDAGMYVQRGTPLFRVASLDPLWLLAEAYESDLAWIYLGQEVSFSLAAFPGETFEGTVSFISPTVNPQTGTIAVRINVPNPSGRLKPDMSAILTIEGRTDLIGAAMDPELADKYICPMHPDIISDHPGPCSICGMPLVKPADLGLKAEPGHDPNPLTIPATAPLITGQRALVYVKTDQTEKASFQLRQIQLGPKIGDRYVVKQGLEEGEIIVARGAFKIDAERQIRGLPAMMDHPPAVTADLPEKITALFQELFEIYADLQSRLAADQSGKALATPLLEAVDALAVRESRLPDSWQAQLPHLKEAAQALADADKIADQRQHFQILSDALITMAAIIPEPEGMFRFHCPMAFDNQGADWLQNQDELANPYFGASMLRCGSRQPLAGGRK